jgi:hypothetical protein
VRKKSAQDAAAQLKVLTIYRAGVLGYFIVITTPLQSHSFTKFHIRSLIAFIFRALEKIGIVLTIRQNSIAG